MDSSVVVAACLAGDPGPLAGHELWAPAHLAAEVTSAIRESAFRGELPNDRALEAVARLPSLQIAYEAPGALALESFRLAADLGWAKTYDAEYIAAARSLDCPLVTLDARLQRGAGSLAHILSPVEL